MSRQDETEPWTCPLCERRFKVPIGTRLTACPDCQNKPILKRSNRPTQTTGDNENDWYIMHGGSEVTNGPLTLQEVQGMFLRGALTLGDFAKQGRRGQLRGIHSISEIATASEYSQLPVSTTDTICIEGVKIAKMLPVVLARRIYGINFFGDISAGVSDLLGGRVERLETAVINIEHELLADIRQRAGELGANGVVGLRMQLGNLNSGGSYMMYGFAQGTPIVFTQPMSDGDGLDAESYFAGQ